MLLSGGVFVTLDGQCGVDIEAIPNAAFMTRGWMRIAMPAACSNSVVFQIPPKVDEEVVAADE